MDNLELARKIRHRVCAMIEASAKTGTGHGLYDMLDAEIAGIIDGRVERPDPTIEGFPMSERASSVSSGVPPRGDRASGAIARNPSRATRRATSSMWG